MDWSNIIISVVSVLCGGGGVFGILKIREDKKKTPYDMLMDMLKEQKRFYKEKNEEYEREKRDSAEKSSVIMQTHRCKYRFKDPDIVCPVDEANDLRLKDRCIRCEHHEDDEDID